MIKLRVLKTTDGKFVGNLFELPSLPTAGTAVPVGQFSFRILFVEEISTGQYRFSNFNYAVIAQIED